jgi:hypothetical protein
LFVSSDDTGSELASRLFSCGEGAGEEFAVFSEDRASVASLSGIEVSFDIDSGVGDASRSFFDAHV